MQIRNFNITVDWIKEQDIKGGERGCRINT